ncbi:MAG TPA: glycoside hydrolase family 15 protein, partial [Steroidobacteraceae bacterium]|nr:glycoside hydrolase family 15 protein [Steroidobacteraceae bacterium]
GALTEPDLNLAVVGNCQISALIDQGGRVVWMCLPRHDGDPIFCSLLGGSRDEGYADVQLVNLAQCAQAYRRNTAIVETVLRDSTGGALRITDFCPRYRRFARMYRPMSLIRIIEPIAGRPVVRVRIRARHDHGAHQPPVTVGSNHIRYQTPAVTVRLTTDAPLTTLLEERPFVLTSSMALVMGPDETLTEAPGAFAHAELEATQRYWLDWARGLAVPFEWQEAVIRAAITLKLCTFEDTGALIAAITTSIPESASSGRNWDYRYCWLRDSYFTVQALNRLGATRTMEAYLRYIMNIIESAQHGTLQPLYGISGETQLTERVIESLPGYRSMGPVRVGNQAFEQTQHDVYGSVILAATQAFFDQRLEHPGDIALFERLEELGERSVALYDKPDSGLWEYRGRTRVHTFSSVMCWAGCDRLARIAGTLGLSERAASWRAHADAMHARISKLAWDERQRSFTESFERPELDASLLLLHELNFLSANDPRFLSTLQAVEKALRRDRCMLRYDGADDFGPPENAFNFCSFWFINALAVTGRREEARDLFEHMLARRTPQGLLSEDLDPRTGELWGNYPQTYSLVGIVNAAMRLSRPWEDAV